MGDVIHTLPAVSDCAKYLKSTLIDWAVEPAFAEIPRWHPRINRVIPIPYRRFRKQPLKMLLSGELKNTLRDLRDEHYDRVIDAQGLVKSAMMTRLSRGFRCGLDRSSAWESLASLMYQKKVSVNPKQHAISRMRALFGKVLGYDFENSQPDYGLAMESISSTLITLRQSLPSSSPNVMSLMCESPYLIFIHGTTWVTKEWPENYWVKLAELASRQGYRIFLPWGSTVEHERATRIAAASQKVTVLPKTTLTELAYLLGSAKGCVSVDTGLGHLAAALSVPTVSLYGPTDPIEIGAIGRHQRYANADFPCAPCWKAQCSYRLSSRVMPACFEAITAAKVWNTLKEVIYLEAG